MNVHAFAIRVGVSLLIAAVFVFFATSPPVEKLKGWAFVMVRPMVSLSAITSHKFSAIFGGISRDDALGILRENQALKASLFEEEKLRDEVSRFHKALSFSEERKLTLLGARVLLFERDLGKEFFIIDRGKRTGVVENALALDENGMLVGVVVEANDGFSKVEIASNPGRTYEVGFFPGGGRALAKGIGGRSFSIELVSGEMPVSRGDFVAAFLPSGARAPFLLGEVTHVQASENSSLKEVGATLLARPDLLSLLFIVGR